MIKMLSSTTIRQVINSASILSILLLMPLHANASKTKICDYWINKVATQSSNLYGSGGEELEKAQEKFLDSDPWNLDFLSEKEKIQAIECLLLAENDNRPANFSGAMRLSTSQFFSEAKVDITALYMISYIYTGRLDHASAIAFRGEGAFYFDKNGAYTTSKKSIHIAYRAYRKWFLEIKKIGISAAKSQALDPLASTEISWY